MLWYRLCFLVKQTQRHNSFYSTLPYFTFQVLHFFRYKLEVYGNPMPNNSINAIFPTAVTHVSLGHSLGNSLSILSFLINVIFVMTICDH